MNNELNIEEIRQICNESIDYLKIGMKNLHETYVKEVADAEKFAQAELAKYQTNSDLMEKISYAFRFAFNLFAVYVLNVDHRMVDFKHYKKEQPQKKVYFNHDSVFQRRNRVVGEVPNTLENARQKINSDEQSLLIFYRWLVDVAYNNTPIMKNMFNTFKEMGVKETYNQIEMQNMVRVCKLSSPNNVLENGIKNLFENRTRSNQNSMTR